MADKNSEIIELKIFNSLLLKELRKSNSKICQDSDDETIEITQLKQLNSILLKELTESRTEIEKLKREIVVLKSATTKFQSSADDQKNRKRKNPNASTNAFEIAFSKSTIDNDFEIENEHINVEKEQEKIIENTIISNMVEKDLKNETFEKNESLMETSEYKCNLCELSQFFTKKDLNLHYSTVHQGNNYSYSQYVSENQKENQNLEKIFIENVNDKHQHRNVCHICNQKFINYTNKRKHLKTFHDVETHFLCDICNKTFSIFSNLQRHKKEHEGRTCPSKSDNKVACNICGKIFPQKRLKGHMKDVHLDLYKCKECDISFTRPELNKHISSVHRDRQNIVI